MENQTATVTFSREQYYDRVEEFICSVLSNGVTPIILKNVDFDNDAHKEVLKCARYVQIVYHIPVIVCNAPRKIKKYNSSFKKGKYNIKYNPFKIKSARDVDSIIGFVITSLKNQADENYSTITLEEIYKERGKVNEA